ncbi:MAG: hypothetical protein EHM28_06030 [Spirochaetaceae bacterium]|nr:MAG: hypothetical protein EHM28_06030 [Spirochaetaceae bacterium]
MYKKTPLPFFLLPVVLLANCTITTTTAIVARFSPPIIVVRDNPDLIVIPGTYVYYMDSDDGDVFFYSGFWWRRWHDSWYRSDHYHGSWVIIDVGYVPYAVVHLPSRWHDRTHEAPRIKWNETERNWNEWERDHYWERRNWHRDEPPPPQPPRKPEPASRW